MLLMIDNYDSFTYNLVQYLGELGAEVEVVRNDQIGIDGIRARAPERIVISPGPCTPSEAGVSLETIRAFAGQVPMLGVCLGHQAIGAAYGAEIVRAGKPMHGKTSKIYHTGVSVFTGLPSPLTATRYHSLVIAPESVPDCLEVIATAEDGEIMAVRHREYPVVGVQFHPESVLTEYGYRMLDWFLTGGRTPNVPDRADQASVPAHVAEFDLNTSPPSVDMVR